MRAEGFENAVEEGEGRGNISTTMSNHRYIYTYEDKKKTIIKDQIYTNIYIYLLSIPKETSTQRK